MKTQSQIKTMKNLLKFVALLIIAVALHSQCKSQNIKIKANGVYVVHDGKYKNGFIVKWKKGSDTIEIGNDPLRVHYIKIGSSVYQISPQDPEIESLPMPLSIDTSSLDSWYLPTKIGFFQPIFLDYSRHRLLDNFSHILFLSNGDVMSRNAKPEFYFHNPMPLMKCKTD